MKNLLTAIALVCITSNVFAGPEPRPGIVLRQTGVKLAKHYKGDMPEVRLYSNGVAMAGQCTATQPQSCDLKKVDHLSAYEMDKIFRLIENARDGEIRRWVSGNMCFRAPDFMSRYTADNNSVFLKNGDICSGGGLLNTAPEAEILLRKIDNLYRKSIEQPNPIHEKCPRPGGVINCMPPTHNPFCHPSTRRWVEENCPGVHYLD